jgi:hypothetical protein
MRLGRFIPVSLQHDLQFASHVRRLPADQMIVIISNGWAAACIDRAA